MNRKLIGFVGIAVFIFGVTTTTKAQMYTAYLNGAQEVPANASPGSGYARVFVNEAALTVTYHVVYSGLQGNQTLWHIHAPSSRTTTGPVIVDFGPAAGGTSGSVTGTAPVTLAQIGHIRSGNAYVNVHSSMFGGGEVRGQLGLRRPVDFDGDGRTDLSVLRFPNIAPPGVSPITYWNRNTTTGVQIIGPWGNANTDFPVPGDYDGDGIDDIAIYRAGATAGAQSDFWILFSSNNIPQHYAWGVFGDQAVPRDYDGDGITDIAVFRPGASPGAQAVWYIRQSSTNTARFVPFGTTGDGVNNFDTPVPGDYDGDGKFDPAVYRFNLTPANHFIVLRSSDNVTSFVQWGNFQTDWIVPGDYDGDGKTDYVAARTGATAATPMVWWILQSSNGQVRVQQFGLSSDFPAQGDYDGDARTDISIYRPGATTSAASFFWTFNSLSNTTVTQQWGLGGDFPVNRFDSR